MLKATALAILDAHIRTVLPGYTANFTGQKNEKNPTQKAKALSGTQQCGSERRAATNRAAFSASSMTAPLCDLRILKNK